MKTRLFKTHCLITLVFISPRCGIKHTGFKSLPISNLIYLWVPLCLVVCVSGYLITIMHGSLRGYKHLLSHLHAGLHTHARFGCYGTCLYNNICMCDTCMYSDNNVLHAPLLWLIGFGRHETTRFSKPFTAIVVNRCPVVGAHKLSATCSQGIDCLPSTGVNNTSTGGHSAWTMQGTVGESL